jgi:hypothetical protein
LVYSRWGGNKYPVGADGVRSMPKRKTILILLTIYAICMVLVCFFWTKPILLTGCYLFISIILFICWHAASDFLFYFLAFVLGPLFELFAIASGAWSYAQPFYFIPTWLPLLWGIAALVVKNLSETLLTNSEPPKS